MEDFFGIDKQYIDGAHPRVWSKDMLQGRFFVQFVALCYLEYLQEQVRQMKASLGRQNEDSTRPQAVIDAENRLRIWIQKNSMDDQLHWFDTTEEVCVDRNVHAYRWNTEIIQRDRRCLQKLGVLPSEAT